MFTKNQYIVRYRSGNMSRASATNGIIKPVNDLERLFMYAWGESVIYGFITNIIKLISPFLIKFCL